MSNILIRTVLLWVGSLSLICCLSGCEGNTTTDYGSGSQVALRVPGGAQTPDEVLKTFHAALPVSLTTDTLVLDTRPPSSVQLPASSLPPVMDQGALSSCGAFAIGYGLTTYNVCKVNGTNPTDATKQSSPAYMYAQACINEKQTAAQAQTNGTTAADYIDFLITRGSQSVYSYPYSWSAKLAQLEAFIQSLINDLPSPDPSFQIGSVSQLKNPVAGIAGNGGINPIQEQLAAGFPVAILVNEYKGQYTWNNKKSTDVFTGDKLTNGRHWMMVVGYDDTIPWTDSNQVAGQGAFLIQNSWGTDFGAKGFWWMSYPAFIASLNEAYVMFPALPPATPNATGAQMTASGGAPARILQTSQGSTKTGNITTVYLTFQTQFDRAVRIRNVWLTFPDGRSLTQTMQQVCRDTFIHFSRQDGSSWQPGRYELTLETDDPTNLSAASVTYKATLNVTGYKSVPFADNLNKIFYGPTGKLVTLQ